MAKPAMKVVKCVPATGRGDLHAWGVAERDGWVATAQSRPRRCLTFLTYELLIPKRIATACALPTAART